MAITKLAFMGFPTKDNQTCKMAIVADPAGRGIMLHQIAPDRG